MAQKLALVLIILQRSSKNVALLEKSNHRRILSRKMYDFLREPGSVWVLGKVVIISRCPVIWWWWWDVRDNSPDLSPQSAVSAIEVYESLTYYWLLNKEAVNVEKVKSCDTFFFSLIQKKIHSY